MKENPGRHPPALSECVGRKGAHLVTVNDYLAKRDASWMAQLYHALGLSVGIIQHDASFLSIRPMKPRTNALNISVPVPGTRPIAPDITYRTNNEYGFDYLRDN